MDMEEYGYLNRLQKKIPLRKKDNDKDSGFGNKQLQWLIKKHVTGDFVQQCIAASY